MPKRSSKNKKPRDLNLLALSIVNEATTDPAPPDEDQEDTKNPHAIALGRLGGLRGGPARAKKLSAAQRSEIAKKAAKARWAAKRSPSK